MIEQLSIDFARSAGDHGMAISLAKAERSDPQFSEKAQAAILSHLRVVGSCSGEVLTDVAKAHGAIPANGDRAFGAVFKGLSRRGLIRCVGYCLRTKGHLGSGGRVWAISQ